MYSGGGSDAKELAKGRKQYEEGNEQHSEYVQK
jgi:hypothetical protein